MLRDHIEAYFLKDHYNCSESLLRAANDYYQLGLHDHDMKMVAGYGAGIQTGSVCGCLLSAVAVLSMKYVEKYAHESSDIKPAAMRMTKRFTDHFSSVMCTDIKPKMFQPQIRCLNTVMQSCDILEQVIQEFDTKI